MANLTLSIADELLRKARIRALEQGTSVNSLVRAWLERYAGDDERSATEAIIQLGDQANAASGAHGREWTRGDAYADRVGPNAG